MVDHNNSLSPKRGNQYAVYDTHQKTRMPLVSQSLVVDHNNYYRHHHRPEYNNLLEMEQHHLRQSQQQKEFKLNEDDHRMTDSVQTIPRLTPNIIDPKVPDQGRVSGGQIANNKKKQ